MPGVIKAFELVVEMIDDQNQPIIVLHDGHFDPTHNESAQAEILFEHHAISLSIVVVEIDMVQLHDCVFPSVRRTRAGRDLDSDDRPPTTDEAYPRRVRPWPRAGLFAQA